LAQSVHQLESEVVAVHQELAELQKIGGRIEQIAESPSGPEPAVVREGMTRLEELGNVAGTKPSQLLLPDGAIVAIRTWTEVLTHCCRFTMQRNSAIKIPFKDAAGKKVDLLALSRPPRGITYFEIEYQGQQVFVYTNYDSNNCVRNALHILDQLPKGIRSAEPAVSYG
jgi:hypothetical protein